MSIKANKDRYERKKIPVLITIKVYNIKYQE
jgi:hypothetical protein